MRNGGLALIGTRPFQLLRLIFVGVVVVVFFFFFFFFDALVLTLCAVSCLRIRVFTQYRARGCLLSYAMTPCYFFKCQCVRNGGSYSTPFSSICVALCGVFFTFVLCND